MTKYNEPPDKYEFEKGARFVLGKTGKRPLIVFGINPSVADQSKPDRTIMKVIQYAKNFGCDGWIMLNIYPQKCKDPQALDRVFNKDFHRENKRIISKNLSRFPNGVLCAAWGINISRRAYLIHCLREIANLVATRKFIWKCIGTTKQGHPRHPSRLSPSKKLHNFDIQKYLL